MWRKIGIVIGALAAAVCALLIGIAAILGAAAATSRPVLFIGAGALAYIIVFGLFVLWFYGRAKSRKTFLASSLSIGSLLFIAAAILILKPLDVPTVAADPNLHIQYWELPTGSRLAYTKLPAKGEAKPYPIVFVHGGPGTPDMAGDARYFGRLANDGYDVYIYDELGTGLSMRLENPAGYGPERDIADLEAIRGKIGADRMILISHSYGGYIVAGYCVSHGDHVVKAVFSSPAAIDPSDHSDSTIPSRLSPGERMKLYARLMYPRSLLAYGLLQVNPSAAHAFAGDKEMDAEFDRVYAITEPGIHAKGKHYDFPLHHLGFYANQAPQSRTAAGKADLRKPLADWKGPALILKGSDDYLSWNSAMDYRHALENSRLIYLEQAGHNLYQDRPELVMETIRSFLADRPLPVEPYTAETPPPAFQQS